MQNIGGGGQDLYYIYGRWLMVAMQQWLWDHKSHSVAVNGLQGQQCICYGSIHNPAHFKAGVIGVSDPRQE